MIRLLLFPFLRCCIWILPAEAESPGEPGGLRLVRARGRQPAGRARLVAPATEVITSDQPNAGGTGTGDAKITAREYYQAS